MTQNKKIKSFLKLFLFLLQGRDIYLAHFMISLIVESFYILNSFYLKIKKYHNFKYTKYLLNKKNLH